MASPTKDDFDALHRKTFRLLEDDTIRFAIQANQQQELIAFLHKLLCINNINFDSKTGTVSSDSISDMLKRAQDPTKASNFTYTLLELMKDTFVLSRRTIIFGNCPSCFHCSPLGFQCARCHYHSAKKIYFVRFREMWRSIQQNRSCFGFLGPPPQFNDQSPADPYALSTHLMNRGFTVPFDCASLSDTSNPAKYRPDDLDLYDISDVSYLLCRMHDTNRIEHFGMTIEEQIVSSTNATYRDVSSTIDTTPWLFTSQQDRINLHNQRIIHRRIPDERYEPFQLYL